MTTKQHVRKGGGDIYNIYMNLRNYWNLFENDCHLLNSGEMQGFIVDDSGARNDDDGEGRDEEEEEDDDDDAALDEDDLDLIAENMGISVSINFIILYHIKSHFTTVDHY